jgi:hypothetical protein
MKSIKNKFTSFILAFTLMTGAVAYPKNEANAAIIIGAGVPGVGAALVGLGIFWFGLTFGVAMNLSRGSIGAICFLDRDLNVDSLNQIKLQLAKEFGMEDNLASVITDYLRINAANAVINSDGSKTIVLSPSQADDVLEKAADAGITGKNAENLREFLLHIPTESEINAIRSELQKASS